MYNKRQKGGDIQKFMSKLPGTPWAKYKGEKHIPKYQYCGPNTRLDIRLDKMGKPRAGEKPFNRVDAACLKHDLAYSKHKDVRGRQKADIELIHDLNEIKNASFGERFGRGLIKTGMKGKIMLGGARRRHRGGALFAGVRRKQRGGFAITVPMLIAGLATAGKFAAKAAATSAAKAAAWEMLKRRGKNYDKWTDPDGLSPYQRSIANKYMRK